MKFRMISLLFTALLIALPQLASAALVTGPSARTQFETFHNTLGDTFVDFESIATGLYTTMPGLPLTLNTTEYRYPLPEATAPANTVVALLPTGFITTPPNHRLMGVRAGNIPDGQSKYQIVFDQPQRRAGLFRIWDTSSVTRFYSGTTMLAEHQNTVNDEFVGYIADSDNTSTWVTRIEFDGVPDDPSSSSNKLYQVGEVDDLFFGTAPPPLPAVTLNPTNLNFGDQLIGTTSASQSITLTNTGTAELNINNFNINGDFTLGLNDCPTSLSPDQSCVIPITFTPTSLGTLNGSLSVTTDASTSPDTVALSGNGISDTVPPEPGPKEIPTLSEWAMILLVLMLAGVGYLFGRSKME